MKINFLRNEYTKKLAADFFRLKKTIPRSFIAMRYLRGLGIEIGALHNPVFVRGYASIKYVDRMTAQALQLEYPELKKLKLIEPDIIADGEKLDCIKESSLDFIIANHFIEHCQDPIQTIKTFYSKLKPMGYLYMAVPDKRFTFDKERPSTEFLHLAEDHKCGPHLSRLQHYQEWVDHFYPECDVRKKALELMNSSYSIHFHVWNTEEFLDFLNKMIVEFNINLCIQNKFSIFDETVFILRKTY